MQQDAPHVARRILAVVAALGLLGGVGTLAALTGSAKAPTLVAGATRAPVAPPMVVFADPVNGWAFYPDCQRLVPTDGCAPELFRTTDGAASWKSVDLPSGAPAVTALWGRLQARGKALVLPWQYGAYLSVDGGDHWSSPTLHGATAVVPPEYFIVREGDQPVLATPSGGTVQALQPPIGLTSPWQITSFGPGRAWVRDARVLAVSVDAGKTWHDTSVGGSGLELMVASPSGDRLARLQIALDRTTLGVAGDGGEYPVRGVLGSADAGTTWQARAITGPSVNGACTVMMADGSLLGVAVDGTQLLRLAPGSTRFAPVSAAPAAVPACLSSTSGLVYGPTLDNRVALSPDGVRWTQHLLAPRPKATPSVAATAAG